MWDVQFPLKVKAPTRVFENTEYAKIRNLRNFFIVFRVFHFFDCSAVLRSFSLQVQVALFVASALRDVSGVTAPGRSFPRRRNARFGKSGSETT